MGNKERVRSSFVELMTPGVRIGFQGSEEVGKEDQIRTSCGEGLERSPVPELWAMVSRRLLPKLSVFLFEYFCAPWFRSGFFFIKGKTIVDTPPVLPALRWLRVVTTTGDRPENELTDVPSSSSINPCPSSSSLFFFFVPSLFEVYYTFVTCERPQETSGQTASRETFITRSSQDTRTVSGRPGKVPPERYS